MSINKMCQLNLTLCQSPKNVSFTRTLGTNILLQVFIVSSR